MTYLIAACMFLFLAGAVLSFLSWHYREINKVYDLCLGPVEDEPHGTE